MTTSIFTTKKLEKIIQKKIELQNKEDTNLLGKWNASVFYIAKKKCLIFVNSITLFSVIIPHFSTSDLKKINQLFLESLEEQFYFEDIETNFRQIIENIGELHFYKTDNDKKINGIINYNISNIGYLKYQFDYFNNLIIRDITQRLNKIPFKQIGWKTPKEAMIETLKNLDS